ncbi:hypothetical protein D3C85_1411360 [compost metagenome]
MHRLGDQLLADPRLPQDQHVQLRVRHHIDLVAQPGHGGGVTYHLRLPLAGMGGGAERLAALAGEPLQQQGIAEGGGGQGPHQPQLLVTDAVELGRVHAVYGQGADEGLI